MTRKTECPDQLTREQKLRIQKWITNEYYGLIREPWKIRELWDSCRDWHLSNGKTRADWEATFRNWIRQEAKFSDPSWARYRKQKRTREPDEMSNVIRLLKGGKE